MVADGAAGQDGQVGAVSKGELGAVNSGQAVGTTCLSVLDDAGNTIVIGEGEGLQTELDAADARSSGSLAPSRKEYAEWACSSA